jgi:uncharacterized repeat protein (TIGR03803 family)
MKRRVAAAREFLRSIGIAGCAAIVGCSQSAGALPVSFRPATDAAVQSRAAAFGYRVLHDFGKGKDGDEPYSSLLYVGGTLYGTTNSGGAYDGGSVFSIDPAGTETVLHNFGYGNDG